VTFLSFPFFIYSSNTLFIECAHLKRKGGERLEINFFVRNYELTATRGACFRTEVAAALKYMTRRDWRNFVLGLSTRGINTAKQNTIIRGWIGAYLKEAETTIAILSDVQEKEAMEPYQRGEKEPKLSGDADDGSDVARVRAAKVDILLARWRQIQRLCGKAIDVIE
jgi:hypothetical protein